MSTDKKSVSARVDADSELAEQFDQYRKKKGMNSKSEAVRSLLRSGLEQEFETDDDDADADADPVQTSRADRTQDDDPIQRNAPLLIGLAFIIGSSGFLSALQAVAGDTFGGLLFSFVGVAIVFAMIPRVIASAKTAFGDDDDARGSGVQA